MLQSQLCERHHNLSGGYGLFVRPPPPPVGQITINITVNFCLVSSQLLLNVCDITRWGLAALGKVIRIYTDWRDEPRRLRTTLSHRLKPLLF